MQILALSLSLALATAQTRPDHGPGRGPWVVSTPEAHGLSYEELDAAANRTVARLRNRICHLVIKEGEIVYEKYYKRGGVNYTSNGYSSTKSSCSALYGIATQQGWASPLDKVRDRNSGTRNCNRDATFQHVLTMTGRSRNLNNPSFSYDTYGTQCLDALHDFIGENNPDGLSSEEWKNKYWRDALGMEHHRWSMPANNGGLRMVCGSDQQITCRDMARSAQLFLNNGVWDGKQLMSEQHAIDARRITVDGGENYGYTLWLKPRDPVDPDVSSFEGMNGQSAYMSVKHNAIVVTMGTDSGGTPAWEETREAIVSGSSKGPGGKAPLDRPTPVYPYVYKV